MWMAPNLLIEVFKRPLPHGKYVVFKIFHPCFFTKSAHSDNILVFSVNFVRIFTIISYFWHIVSWDMTKSASSRLHWSKIWNYCENSDKINRKTPKYSHNGPIFWKNKDEIFWKPHIFHVGGVSWKPLSTDWVVSIVWKKIRTRALYAGLCSEKSGLPAIGLMKWNDLKNKNYLH